MIAFLGMGLLGSNFTRNALRRGEQVSVWNRTRARALPLEADGARICDDAAEAVRGVSRVHLALSDDAAVDKLLEHVLPACSPGTVIIDHTTTSVDGTRARHARLAEKGFEFHHAPVFMGPQQALEAKGAMLISGAAEACERIRPELAKMTGKLVYLGPDPARAAAFKLIGNLFLICMTAGVGEALALGRSTGMTSEEAAKIFEIFNPALTLKERAARIAAQDGVSASWELQMARKDVRLMLEASGAAGAALPVLSSIAQQMDHAIGRGHAHDDWTVFAREPSK